MTTASWDEWVAKVELEHKENPPRKEYTPPSKPPLERDYELDHNMCDAWIVPELNSVALRDRNGVHVIPLLPSNGEAVPVLTDELITHLEAANVPVEAVTAWAVRLDIANVSVSSWDKYLAADFATFYSGWWPSEHAYGREVAEQADPEHFHASTDFVQIRRTAAEDDAVSWYVPGRNGGLHVFWIDGGSLGRHLLVRALWLISNSPP